VRGASNPPPPPTIRIRFALGHTRGQNTNREQVYPTNDPVVTGVCIFISPLVWNLENNASYLARYSLVK